MTKTLYTIGHSNVPAERSLELLTRYQITAVADVRSQPYSRFNPQFNRETLASFLNRSGLEYVFLGRELGARSEDPSCYRDGIAQYSLIAKTNLFANGIQRLLSGMDKFRVAIMCAEKEPLHCHRTILIARCLHQHGVRVRHILADGSVEDHESLLLRLQALHGLQDNNLFRSQEELIAIAYERQAEQMQYAAKETSQSA
jgi:uncharacterized protein (DUF488 family)